MLQNGMLALPKYSSLLIDKLDSAERGRRRMQ